MYLLRRVAYYLTSLLTFLQGVRNWPSLFRLLRRPDVPVTLTLRDGTRFAVCSLMDAWIVKETNLDRDYEVYGAPLQDGWNVVDIGAGLGDFTVYAARRLPHGRVFACEPAPGSVSLLERNLVLNAISNVQVLPYAVSARAGTLHLDVSGNEAVQYRTTGNTSGNGARITVQSLPLADVLAMLPRGVCDYLKMDCEGAEYDILLNLDDILMRKIKRVCLEYHLFVTQYSQVDLVDLFENRGWNVHLYPSKVRKDLGLLYAERQ